MKHLLIVYGSVMGGLMLICIAVALADSLSHKKTNYGVVDSAYVKDWNKCIYVLKVDTGHLHHQDTCCKYGWGDTINLNK